MKTGDKVKYTLTALERVYLNHRLPAGGRRFVMGDQVDAEVVAVHDDGCCHLLVPGLPLQTDLRHSPLVAHTRVAQGEHVGHWRHA